MIKTLVEYAEATEPGKSNNIDWMDDLDEWITNGIGPNATIQQLRKWIATGRIRIKPETITLYEYIHGANADSVSWSDKGPEHDIYLNFTGRIICNAVIDQVESD